MAGPRISPQQTFRTANGRQLPADEMRAAIHRLNAQHIAFGGQSTSVGFQATSPKSMEALVGRPPSAPAVVTGGARMKLTCITRQDFDMRPTTAGTSAIQADTFNHRGWAGCARPGPRPTSRLSINRSANQSAGVTHRKDSTRNQNVAETQSLNRQNCTSEFARKLTLQQQISMADRLSKPCEVKRFSTSTGMRARGNGARSMKRSLSLWERPGEVHHSFLACHQHTVNSTVCTTCDGIYMHAHVNRDRATLSSRFIFVA